MLYLNFWITFLKLENSSGSRSPFSSISPLLLQIGGKRQKKREDLSSCFRVVILSIQFSPGSKRCPFRSVLSLRDKISSGKERTKQTFSSLSIKETWHPSISP